MSNNYIFFVLVCLEAKYLQKKCIFQKPKVRIWVTLCIDELKRYRMSFNKKEIKGGRNSNSQN